MAETTLHIGRKISKIRELKGMKQESLANILGVSQQSISKIEQSQEVEDLVLDKIANALGITSDAIKNFSEDAAIYNIQNNYDGSSSNFSGLHHCTFNPLDKLMVMVEENKKLYEQLLASEREKVDLLKSNKN